MTSLTIVKRHVGEEEKDVGERDIGSVDAEVVRADTEQRQRRRERNPLVVAAGRQTDGVAGFSIEGCAAESPAGQPAVAQERFKVIVGIGERHGVHDSAVSAAVDKVARNTTAPRITVFVVAFFSFVCISRMNRVGGEEQSGRAFRNNGLHSDPGVGEVASGRIFLGNHAGGEGIDNCFPNRTTGVFSRSRRGDRDKSSPENSSNDLIFHDFFNGVQSLKNSTEKDLLFIPFDH